jgi:dTDP-4-amino-4,6-dideoxygalactose transaminase
MLALKNENAYPTARKLRWFGLDKQKPRLENDITFAGYKYHMNNVNASIGLTQLAHMPEVIGRHIANGQFFDRDLADVPGVTLVPYYPNTSPSYWLYTLTVENRDGFIRRLTEAGITASPLHKRNDRHTVFKNNSHKLEALDVFYEKFVHIPCGWWVTDEERQYIADTIRRGW